jgi:hypothetical protein
MADSGVRRKLSTGATREASPDKERPDLISPLALRRVGRWLSLGAKKYSARDWEKGVLFSCLFASLMRHALKYAAGWKDEDHLAAIVFHAQALMHFEEMGRRELDDMPHYEDGPKGAKR